MATVLARVERGLACGARGEALGELLVLRAEAHRWRADYTASIEAAQLAMAVLPPGTRGWCSAATQAIVGHCALAEHQPLDDLLRRISDAPALDPIERVRALARGCVNLYLGGRYDRADQLLDRLEGEVARAGLGDEPLAMARVLEARAFREGARAEQGRALALLERVLVEHERAGDLRSACLARNNLGYTFVQLGAYTRAAALLETTLRDAERMGQPFISVLAQQNLGVALAALGQHDRAVEVLQASIDDFEKQDDMHMAAVSRAYMAAERLRIGDAEGAARGAQRAADTLAHTPPSHALALAVQAHAQLALGAAASALIAARQAHAILESLGGLDEGEMLVRLGLAAALEANGKLDEARAVASVGDARLAALADKLPEELRANYLEQVAENAALRRLAERLML
jgi:tetratricopeptide (TPR) repeat protein